LTNLFFQCSKIVVIVSTLLILLTRFIATSRGDSNDLLAYTVIRYGDISLMLYDLSSAVNTSIFNSKDFIWFSLSNDGQLAYSSNEGSNGEIYVLDTRQTDQQAINITQMPTSLESPLAWSPDGSYLAFMSSEGGKLLLYIWNGETAFNITPEDMPENLDTYSTAWSDDGRLAFTVYFDYSAGGYDPSNEIYLWDGNTITNLSDNPTGEDKEPVWSMDGQIAFLSERNDEYDIYVWDGVSMKDGSPDSDTFINVAPELTSFMSWPIWTNTGLLSFLGFNPQDNSNQIYVWDGQTATSISQNRTLESGFPRWNSDGRFVIIPFFDPRPHLYVYNSDNYLLMTTSSWSPPVWSPNGLLMFCTPRKELTIWDGNLTVKIASGEIRASWGNGETTGCSSG
jgi:Tol biopolymer transport system component